MDFMLVDAPFHICRESASIVLNDEKFTVDNRKAMVSFCFETLKPGSHGPICRIMLGRYLG